MEHGKVSLGPLGQNIQDSVTAIVNRAYMNAENMVSAQCEIPDGFIRMRPDVEGGENFSNESDDAMDNMKKAVSVMLSATFPAMLTAFGIVTEIPTVAVVLLSGGGGILGSYAQRIISRSESRESKGALQELQCEKLTKERIQITVTTDRDKQKQYMDESKREVEKLCEEVANFENKVKGMHDISTNRGFGEWVQDFLVYADEHPDDRDLQKKRDSLVNCLAAMKIHVYDEVVLNEAGEPDVPRKNYLIDSRTDTNSEYTQVKKPAIYSDKAMLARGEII